MDNQSAFGIPVAAEDANGSYPSDSRGYPTGDAQIVGWSKDCGATTRIDDVYKTVFGASYLVLGLGDVYLGAPVATPIDPRHRLVTTKYNPARTWTPENAVGIGGAYLCIYGMEGPGGYQFVGRTLQVYNRFRATSKFAAGTPWLLRFFDQIRFYPVSAEELLEGGRRGAFEGRKGRRGPRAGPRES